MAIQTINKYPSVISAAVLEKTSKPLRIVKLSFPKLKKGQVLVKIIYSGICGSQLMEISGKRGKDNWLPHLLGHEASGEVLEVGSGVKKVKQSDKVILTWIKATGIEAKETAKYYSKKKLYNSGHVTTFSNYSIVSENRLILMPRNLSYKEAVLFGCALPTGCGIVINELKIKKNKIIAIIGLGGIGLSALIALQSYSCKKIICIDTSDKKLKFAKKLGATETINPNKSNLLDKINFLTQKQGLDACIEAAGLTETIELGFSLLNKNKGKLIFASHPDSRKKISIDPFELISGKSIKGSWGGSIKPDRDIQRINTIVTNNKISINKMISKVYSLNEINKAILDMKKGRVFRPIIKMKH